MRKDIPRIRIGQSNLDVLTFSEAVEHILDLSQRAGPSFIVTPNADHVVMLEDNKDFRNAYKNADLFLCDGMPLLWASYLTKTPIRERITGADLLPAVAKKAAASGKSIFLLGAAPGVAEVAALRLQRKISGLNVAGVYAPPPGFEKSIDENSKAIDLINECKPDIVFVALGAPKQELWIRNNLSRLNRGVFIGVGAAIDFAAGNVNRAPKVLQKIGLEWLYRWWTDPKRLTKRYLKDFRFFFILFKQRYSHFRNGFN